MFTDEVEEKNEVIEDSEDESDEDNVKSIVKS